MHAVRGEAAIVALAARRHGVITTADLTAAGIGRSGIAHRVRQGRLTRLHHGVYLVGPVAPPHARAMAALLACGPAAVLSHHAAAALWELRPACEGAVDVTTTAAGTRSRPGIRVHVTRRLARGEVRERHHLRITSPARTLLDLAAQLSTRDLHRAVEQAEVLRLATARELHDVLDRHAGARGAKRLGAALNRHAAPALTRSAAELRLLELVRAAALPEPLANAGVRGNEVDLLWRDERLVVEVDGFAFHSGRAAFERDRARDADLQAAGYRVLRFTWRQLTATPERVIARLAGALAQPKNTSTVSNSFGSSSFGSASASASGTRTISVPRSATICP